MGTVNSLLAEHVSFRCTSVDRIGIRGYIPGLQYEGGVVKFLLNRGNFIPSPAALNHNHQRLATQLEALVAATGVPVVRFKTGECKEDIARPYQDGATAAGRSGLVLVGKAQERTSVWRSTATAIACSPSTRRAKWSTEIRSSRCSRSTSAWTLSS